MTALPQQALSQDHPDELKLSFMGDVCLATKFGSETGFSYYYKNYGASYFFQDVKEGYGDSDFVFANLETVFTDLEDYHEGKIYTYKALPKYLSILKESGITNVAVVNNHMHDYLQEGFEDSVTRLESSGIDWFGSMSEMPGTDELGSIDVDRKIIIEKKGFRIGLLSYYGFSGSYRTEEDIKNDIALLNKQGVEYIIAYVHWGGQNDSTLVGRQTQFGHFLVDQGVDLIIGGHPHILQEIEVYNGKHIYYSLGDFISFDKSPKNPDGLLVNLTLSRDSDGNIQESFENKPVLWAGSETQNYYQPIFTTDPLALERVNSYLKLK